jgi:magnesium chelatase family protein
MNSIRQINIPHFTIENLQVKPITIQLARKSSVRPTIRFSGIKDPHIKESIVRVTVLFQNMGLVFPQDTLTLHFTPAIADKRGADYDLAIALGLLYLFDRIPAPPSHYLFLAELGLDGSLLGSDHFLAFYRYLINSQNPPILVTAPTIARWLESSGHSHTSVPLLAIPQLTQVIQAIQDGFPEPSPLGKPAQSETSPPPPSKLNLHPFQSISGLYKSKLATYLTLITELPLLLIGPPGVGKTLLIQSAKPLLPPLTFNQWLRIHQWSRFQNLPPVRFEAPFRSPHYLASLESLVGSYQRFQWIPGEFTLANGGVLFLDELPHFRPQVLEALRTPLQDKTFLFSRAGIHLDLPADFVVMAAMNPCLCGQFFFNPIHCTCSHRQITAYLSRISGPIRERFGLVHILQPQAERTPIPDFPEFLNSADILEFRHIFQNSIRNSDHRRELAEHLHHYFPDQNLSERKQDHLCKISQALAILRSKEMPDKTDWQWALEFQQAGRLFVPGLI